MTHSQIQFGFDVSGGGTQRLEVEELVVQQVRWNCVAEGVQHRGADVRNLLFELRDERLHSRSLQIGLRAAQIARNYREVALRCVLRDVTLGTVSHGPDD